MKELIEKIVDRLEKEGNEIYREPIEHPLRPMVPTGKKDILVSHAIRIIQEEAKAYNESVKGDLISRSALIDVLNAERKQDRSRAYAEHECDLIAGTIAMCTDFVKAMPTACNDVWIPCSERLPEDCTIYEVTAQFGNGMCYIEFAYYDESRGEWWKHDDDGLVNVLAWKEHSIPYQPKGE